MPFVSETIIVFGSKSGFTDSTASRKPHDGTHKNKKSAESATAEMSSVLLEGSLSYFFTLFPAPDKIFPSADPMRPAPIMPIFFIYICHSCESRNPGLDSRLHGNDKNKFSILKDSNKSFSSGFQIPKLSFPSLPPPQPDICHALILRKASLRPILSESQMPRQ